MRKARGGSQLSDDVAPNLDRLAVIADPMAFRWIRPDHMEPTGQVPSDEVRALLREQRDECLALLDTLRNGEGLLVTVSMSVNGLGKMDLYQWLYFVAQHAKRHLVQLARNEANFAD